MTLKTVFMTTKPMEAQVVHALLRENDIVSFIENDFGNLLGLTMQAPMSSVLVRVDESQEAEALKIIGNEYTSTPRTPSAPSKFIVMPCASCGKNLEISEGEDAPEECPWCGHPPTVKA